MIRFKKVEIEHIETHVIEYQPYDMEPYLHQLDTEEHKRFDSFNSIKRKYEFLSTRILKNRLFPNETINYLPSGAPRIGDEFFISISHTQNKSAIAISKDFEIGLDIEPTSNKAQRLYSKFLNEDEIALLNTADELEMTKAWSCKESLYKLANRKGIIFKQDLLILDFKDNIFTCRFRREDQHFLINLKSIVIDDVVFTINCEPKRPL